MKHGRNQMRKSAQPDPLIAEFPQLAEGLEASLVRHSEHTLAQTVRELRIYDEEGSGLYTTVRRPGVRGMLRAFVHREPAWGRTHRNIQLDELDVVLDIVEERIAFIELLDPARWKRSC